MKIQCTWSQKMKLVSTNGEHSVEMDAKSPSGSDSALNPKELVLSGLCGCTAMDVLSLLNKYQQPYEAFEISAEAEMSASGHPKVFTRVHLSFLVAGSVDAAKLLESVELSQTKYCGVSAMLSAAMPITYSVSLNGNEIGKGSAKFSKKEVGA